MLVLVDLVVSFEEVLCPAIRGGPKPFGSLWPSRGHCSASEKHRLHQVWEIHRDTSPALLPRISSHKSAFEGLCPHPPPYPAFSVGVGQKSWRVEEGATPTLTGRILHLAPPYSQACRQLKGLLGGGGKVHPSQEREKHTVGGRKQPPKPIPPLISCRPPPALTPDSLCRGKHFSFLPGR